MCKVLEVSCSAYYAWRKEPYGKRYKHSSRIQRDIKRIYFAAKGRYSSPRIAKEMGLKSKLSCKYRQAVDYSHKEPVAENILNRDFTAKYPGIKCVSDITYLPTNQDFAYLIVVIDLFDRQPIGWTISDRITAAETIIPALQKAVRNRKLQGNMFFTLIEMCNMPVERQSIISNPTISPNR